ncbi:MAG: phosphoribulokinase/uridine kinase, partial [Dehalococcoidia bacterium]
AYLPGALAGWAGEALFGLRSTIIGIGVMALLFDLAVVRALGWFPLPDSALARRRYWLSPIAVYVTFWHGQLDVLPVLGVLIAAALLLRGEGLRSGLVLGLAVGAKLSMVVAVPFFVVYALRNRNLRTVLRQFVPALTAVAALGLVPALYSSGFHDLVFSSPEFLKVSSARIQMGDDLAILILPSALLLLIYYVWSVGPMSKGLFLSSLGTGFLLILILTPPSPGWFLWVLPFVAMYESRWRRSWLLAGAYGVAAVGYSLVNAAGAGVPLLGIDGSEPLAAGKEIFFTPAESLALSVVTAFGTVLAYRMLRHGVTRSSVFAPRRRPLALGIAGDSASGKDTLASALSGVFGAESTTVISGDNYHTWDRHEPMWRSVTHLDPAANQLDSFSAHVLQVLGGGRVQARTYDHETGRFSALSDVPNNDVVIVAGLHALYPATLRRVLDVKVFLDHD